MQSDTIGDVFSPPSEPEPGKVFRDLIVVGASAGGVEALSELVRSLPADLPASVFVVLHMPRHGASVLPLILSRRGRLPARVPDNGETIRQGVIYVAPPDRHLIIEGDRVRVTQGPSENGHRPAIDPLFRSAARAGRACYRRHFVRNAGRRHGGFGRDRAARRNDRRSAPR